MEKEKEEISQEFKNDPERFMRYEKAEDENNSLEKSERAKEILNLIDKDSMKILDVGGASGVFLDMIMRETKHKIMGYNLELDSYYKDKQCNKEIKFINGSILDSKIKDNQFDIITFRHVLHHLVGKTLKETKRNQKKALAEMFRLLKKDGYLIFEEEVNKVKIFSSIVYYLSKWANKLGIKSQGFQAGDVIVSFLTPRELREMIEGVGVGTNIGNDNEININNNERKEAGEVRNDNHIEIIKMSYKKWRMGLKWKMTLVMGRVGSEFVVGRKK